MVMAKYSFDTFEGIKFQAINFNESVLILGAYPAPKFGSVIFSHFHFSFFPDPFISILSLVWYIPAITDLQLRTFFKP